MLYSWSSQSGGIILHRIFLRISEELAGTTELTATAKTIHTVAMTSEPSTIQSLAAKLALNRGVVTKHCRKLSNLGWMQFADHGKSRRPIAIIPQEVEAKAASEARDLIGRTPFQGEATFKGFVLWIVSPTVKVFFNTRPSFLLNKATGNNLECDIEIPDHAWVGEYLGDQHFGPTNMYKGDKEFQERVQRDRLKVELCRQHSVRLSSVTKHDLTLERILEALPDDIPRRFFDPKGPFIEMLELLGQKIAKGRDWDRD